jgi:hypothetical protein
VPGNSGCLIPSYEEVTMKGVALAGALMFSFALGGVTTLLGFPRHAPAPTAATATISPEELTRSAGPLPELVLDSHF